MRIGIDIRVLMDKHYSGVSEYTANLLKAILRLNAQLAEPDEYYLFYNSFHNLTSRLSVWQQEHVTLVSTRWPNKIFNYLLQKFLGWPKIDQVLGGVDVFWSPHFNFTCLSSGATVPKKIVTVHDLSFLRYPKFFSHRQNVWHRILAVKGILRRADKIVAVSENTKNDLGELTQMPPEKIQVIYSGNNLIKREVPSHEAAEFLEAKKINFPFILYLGTIEPRKNLGSLIAAFNELVAKNEKLKGVQLVLAGAAGWKTQMIYRAWKKSPYSHNITFLGYVSQKEKEILYSQAKVFVYPSFYEGFGFPPLEALIFGVPVICSNVSSLPEVVGSAALLINPFKISELAEALATVLQDQGVREKLVAAGYERVKLFSWDKAAREYLQLFKDQHDPEK